MEYATHDICRCEMDLSKSIDVFTIATCRHGRRWVRIKDEETGPAFWTRYYGVWSWIIRLSARRVAVKLPR